jgi:hypothetical protein
MVVRILRTTIDVTRAEDYCDFAHSRYQCSAPCGLRGRPLGSTRRRADGHHPLA